MENPEEGMLEFFKRMADRFMRDMAPDSDNPEEYPRSVKIIDDDALMILAQLDVYRRELHRLSQQMELKWHESEAAKTRLFIRLEEQYPTIKGDLAPNGGQGFRKWRGDTWYVSWDRGRGTEGSKS